MATFVISDTHFGHVNMLKFERKEFNTIEEHDDYIIKKWNERVHKNDTIYHLGDVGIQNKDYLSNIISKLNGYKILILGNHDRDSASIEFYKTVGFNEVYNNPVYFNSKIILSHEPIYEAFNNPYVLNIHGHLHNSFLNLENYHNVSAALVKYIPQNIERFIKKTYEFKKRDESFLEEWYVKHYIFTNFLERNDIVCDDAGIINLEKSYLAMINKNKDETTPLELNNQIVFIYEGKFVKATIIQLEQNYLVAKKRKKIYFFNLNQRNTDFFKIGKKKD